MLRVAQEDMADLLEQYPALLDSLRGLASKRRRDANARAQLRCRGCAAAGGQRPSRTASLSVIVTFSQPCSCEALPCAPAAVPLATGTRALGCQPAASSSTAT